MGNYGGAALAAVSVDRAPCALAIPEYMEAHAHEMEFMLFQEGGVPTNLDVLQVVHHWSFWPRADIRCTGRIIGASHCSLVEQVLPGRPPHPIFATVLACGRGVRQLNGHAALHLTFNELMDHALNGEPIDFRGKGVHFESWFQIQPFARHIVLPRGDNVDLAVGFVERGPMTNVFPVQRYATDPVTQFNFGGRCVEEREFRMGSHSLHDYPDTDPERNVVVTTRDYLTLELPEQAAET